MTIDEMINLEEEMSEKEKERGFEENTHWNRETALGKYCYELSERHHQIAEWLKELKHYRQAIEDIKSEINELSELDHAEPTYEDCKRDVLEIIDRHTSGAKEGRMQIVIDLPDDVYSVIVKQYRKDKELQTRDNLYKAIANGTPLPKGHGRLIDADYLKDVILLHSFHGNNKNIVPYSDRKGYRLRQREVEEGIINAPVIIEADREEQE